ncbi:MAG: UDP-N-acetylmuramate dehydrogenase [Patescibacteria group bacterium]|jgi:UDP-N-acetylmuramate dehydrogenase
MNHDQVEEILTKNLPGVQQNVLLRQFTTMRVGGASDFLIEVSNIDDLVKALKTCFENDIPYIVLGGGSNVIASDSGFPGLTIINHANHISFVLEKSQVMAESGAILAQVVTEAAGRELGGLEWWFGLPGTLGGAVHNNSETWGHSMSEIVKSVTILFPPTNGEAAKIEQVDVNWMGYGYRTSKLKQWHTDQKPVILSVTLQLRQQRKDEILRRMKESKQGRWDLNQPKGIASAGSYFKNPGGASHAENADRKPEDSAGWLLDQVGAKKMRVGDAGVAKEHANFVTNGGKASASEIKQLSDKLKHLVKEKFDINLEEEVEYIGTWAKH